MTQTNLFEKRKKSIEHRKNRLKELESSLNTQERKKRTRHLIELGGLIAKANLEKWNSNTLLGAFVFLKDHESDKNQMDAWTHKGGAIFASEKILSIQNRKSQGVAVIVKFSSPPNEAIKTSLKFLGLKWNVIRQEWEGYAIVEELRSLLKEKEANITEMGLS